MSAHDVDQSHHSDGDRATISDIEFIGEATLPTGEIFSETEVGGLSGITYVADENIYYAISDDRSENNDARFYTLSIDLSDGALGDGDVTFETVTTLLNAGGSPFSPGLIDPEGIAFSDNNTLYISSEGDANNLLDPFVANFALDGTLLGQFDVPAKYSPTADQSAGIRNNLAFESLTITPDQRFVFTATENALFQDGPAAALEQESFSRILQFDAATGQPVKEFIYETERVPDAPIPPDAFSTNGLVDLLAIDNNGTLLALERAFSVGVGNSVKLFEVLTPQATDVSDFDGLQVTGTSPGFPDGPEVGELFGVDQPVIKREIFDFSELGITLDNDEGLTFGPTLPDGRQSLIVVSDNNFSDTQFTQFLGFALDVETLKSAAPTIETPDDVRFGDAETPDPALESDPDDPAIWIHPSDSELSVVIATRKNSGITVFDLDGQPIQILEPDGIRYNNVDVTYNFALGDEPVDIAVASDRANDTLAIFAIDPDIGTLTDITSPFMPETIFGVDDGEQTAYGAATYTSPIDGAQYAFVTQADGDQIAQLRLFDDGSGLVNARVVRTLQLPVDGEPEDSQSESIVIDRETGQGYVAVEDQFGILKFVAEPTGSDELTLIQPIDAPYLTPDIEGLSIYYGADGTGYLIASSQGDATYAVFSREGANEYLGSFVIGPNEGIDAAQETDGIDITNVALGEKFPFGLMVVQDGSNEPAVVFQDPEDGEIQNFNANFKFVPYENVAETQIPNLFIDTESYDPRVLHDESGEMLMG